jgi:hypothetical protein
MGIWSRLFPPAHASHSQLLAERRSSASGFTSEIMAARASYITGKSGIAELTATAQAAISLWESSLAMADVTGTDLITRTDLAMTARSLALRGEACFLIREDRLVPCSDWDLRTRDGQPVAYRVGISEAGGGRSETVLAAETLHFRIGVDANAPWIGTAPLRRARLTAALLQAVETVLSEIFEFAPLGSQVLPFPESPQTDMEALGRSFRGVRGGVLLRESVAVSAAGGVVPATDWRPADMTPDLARAMTSETLADAKDSILTVFGILPSIFERTTTGPLVREAQRHMIQFCIQPIASLLAEEASAKLGTEIKIDCIRPLGAFDQGSRARAFGTLIEALAAAKAAGLTAEELQTTFGKVAWDDDG